jgi:phosphate transport system substrate-binding protein
MPISARRYLAATPLQLNGGTNVFQEESRMSSVRTLLSLALIAVTVACSGGKPTESGGAAPAASGVVIRLTGSDTMVNLNQAWAENYRTVKPGVSVQVAGGGSGVGIAGLIDGILDIAASSRKMEPGETEKATKSAGAAPREIAVGLDALAVFVHEDNPLTEISIEELAQIYGDGGKYTKWSQLGMQNTACASDEIIRVSRQNNSGTYAYFREAVLGRTADFKLGSVDQSGSKDVAALVERTPCAIGYSGMAYISPGVHALKISKKKGEPAIEPTVESALSGAYPIARPLYFYTRGAPTAEAQAFIDWTLSDAGQKILQDIGYVPAPKASK